jgi:hypothetical protein
VSAAGIFVPVTSIGEKAEVLDFVTHHGDLGHGREAAGVV